MSMNVVMTSSVRSIEAYPMIMVKRVFRDIVARPTAALSFVHVQYH